jgi:hypothetical protein
METQPAPTVDVRAPNGRRILLRPKMPLERIPGASRGGLAVALVLCATWFATSVNRLNHTDLWGHLSYGRWIVEHGALPTSDPFRSFADPSLFVNTPWLSQVLGYLCYRLLGAEGLVLAHASFFTLTAGLLMAAVSAKGVSGGWTAAAGAAFYLLCLPIVGTLRPQVLGMAAFAAALWAITLLPKHRHPLIWLPLCFALWANLHGSCLMGLAAVACSAAGDAWDRWQGGGEGSQRGEKCEGGEMSAAGNGAGVGRLWLALLLCTAACCLNPLGIHLLTTAARFAGAANLDKVSEWRRTDVLSLTGGLLLVSLALTVALVRYSPRRLAARDAILLVVLGCLAAASMRMLVWWGLFWPWFAAPHAAAVWRKIWPAHAADLPAKDEATPARRRTVIAAMVAFLTLLWSPPGFALFTGRPRPESAICSPDTPYQVAEAMAKQQVRGRIFAPMDWADYLIWRTHGAIEPMVYTHVHLSSPQLWEDSVSIQLAKEGWLELADRYKLRGLVVSLARQPSLRAAIEGQPRCCIRYHDAQALLVEITPRPSGL